MEYRYENPVDKKYINVVQFGLGPIGISAAKTATNIDMITLTGAVDIDPEKIGKDLGTILNNSSVSGITVSESIDEIFQKSKVDVVIHTTSSFIDVVFDQLKTIMEGGANVVSSTEELFLADLKNAKKAKELDAIAKANDVTCLGTGVNPGFVMDSFVVFLTSMCNKVDHILAIRKVDASTRRAALQKKIGAGLLVDEFRSLADAGKLGHIGLKESVAFVAKGVGWQLDSIEETIEPVVADEDLSTDYFEIKKGTAAGIKNIGIGYFNGKELVKLDLRIYVGAKDPHDAVKITGEPTVDVTVNGGIAGDSATIASLVNNIPRVIQAPPGLCSMKDITLPHIFSGKSNF